MPPDSDPRSRRVRLLISEDRLRERVRRILTGMADLRNGPSFAPGDALVVFYCPRLGPTERLSIEACLREHPRRTAILCRESDAHEVYSLAVSSARLGLIAVESDLSAECLSRRLPAWLLGGFLRPDWSALGLANEEGYLLGKLKGVLELDPPRNWSVEQLARRLRVSPRTLNRALRAAANRGVKTFLIDLRHQLIEQAMADDLLNPQMVAELFGFQSRKQLLRWCSAARRRHSDSRARS